MLTPTSYKILTLLCGRNRDDSSLQKWQPLQHVSRRNFPSTILELTILGASISVLAQSVCMLSMWRNLSFGVHEVNKITKHEYYSIQICEAISIALHEEAGLSTKCCRGVKHLIPNNIPFSYLSPILFSSITVGWFIIKSDPSPEKPNSFCDLLSRWRIYLNSLTSK